MIDVVIDSNKIRKLYESGDIKFMKKYKTKFLEYIKNI